MAFSLDPGKFMLEASEFATPTRQINLRRGQAYYGASQQPGALVTPLTADIDSGGTQLFGMAPQKEFMAQTRFAGDALDAFGMTKAAKKLAKAQKRAAADQKKGSMIGGALSAIGNIGAAAIFACDERFKHDMAPLQMSEVNDDLAKMAFAVQGIRGHS